MLIKIIISLVALPVSGWMIFDGIYVQLYGKYFGPEKPGPWSDLVPSVGFDPFYFGKVFIVLGMIWFVFLGGLLLGQSWAWYGALIVAFATLWYLPVGTVLALIYIVLLVVFGTQLKT